MDTSGSSRSSPLSIQHTLQAEHNWLVGWWLNSGSTGWLVCEQAVSDSQGQPGAGDGETACGRGSEGRSRR
eukprot:358662-Chlamydomonas_euryale.AAC.3